VVLSDDEDRKGQVTDILAQAMMKTLGGEVAGITLIVRWNDGAGTLAVATDPCDERDLFVRTAEMLKGVGVLVGDAHAVTEKKLGARRASAS
jgi:hypothetical protein